MPPTSALARPPGRSSVIRAGTARHIRAYLLAIATAQACPRLTALSPGFSRIGCNTVESVALQRRDQQARSARG